MNKKTRTLTLTAILIAITLLFGFTPIGYIQTPFGIVITLMCLPVIIGTLTLGWKAGLALAALFAVTSIAKIPSDVFGPTLLAADPVLLMVNIIVPRLLIPLVVALVYRVMHTKRELLNIGVAGVAGSLTNMVLFLGFLYALFCGGRGAPVPAHRARAEKDGAAAWQGGVRETDGGRIKRADSRAQRRFYSR